MNTSKRRSCHAKIRHRNRHAARLALTGTIRETGDTGVVFYHCRFCNGFHIGHPPKAEQKALRAKRLIDLIERVNNSKGPRCLTTKQK